MAFQSSNSYMMLPMWQDILSFPSHTLSLEAILADLIAIKKWSVRCPPVVIGWERLFAHGICFKWATLGFDNPKACSVLRSNGVRIGSDPVGITCHIQCSIVRPICFLSIGRKVYSPDWGPPTQLQVAQRVVSEWWYGTGQYCSNCGVWYSSS